MPIIRVNSSDGSQIGPRKFGDEKELEEVIRRYPNLLIGDHEPDLAFVGRQITLPDSGILDLLMVNSEGLPVAVEVKLGRNPQSRREVIGQVVDYVSVLTSMTVDELDEVVAGALEGALRSFDPDNSEKEFERRWRAVGTNLRAGLARYVIAIEDPPADIERITRFLAERSKLDLRLVEIAKYPDSGDQTIYVPRKIIGSMPENHSSAKEQPRSELQTILEQYARICEEEFQTGEPSRSCAQISIPGCPGGLHYEFLQFRKEMGVEIHIEKRKLQKIADRVKKYSDNPPAGFQYKLEWDQSWGNGNGRLRCVFPISADPLEVAKAMKLLIAFTHADIKKEL